MEKSKLKIFKIALIVIAIMICILIAVIARRAIILSKIDKKVTEIENNNNILHKNTRRSSHE